MGLCKTSSDVCDASSGGSGRTEHSTIDRTERLLCSTASKAWQERDCVWEAQRSGWECTKESDKRLFWLGNRRTKRAKGTAKLANGSGNAGMGEMAKADGSVGNGGWVRSVAMT